MDGFGFAGHVIHQQVLPECVRRSEIGFAAAHFRDLLHKLNQSIFRRQHEGVDQNAGALTLGNLLQGLAYHHGVESEGILINSAIFEGER